MMIHYCEVDTLWQILLLLVSLVTVILLAVGCILVFRNRALGKKQLVSGGVFLLNLVSYILMQLNNHISIIRQTVHLHIPYAVILLLTVLSLVYAVLLILSETKNRASINNTSIKEAFDNLPTGVCFFNESGLPVLCNRAMTRFSFAVCGRGIQHISDLAACLSEEFVPFDGVRRSGKTFRLANGRVWTLDVRTVRYESGVTYTQYLAIDVTDLKNTHAELTAENERLRRVQEDLKQLSANVVTVTREEEILNTKMRVHDEMGRCLMESRKYLKQDNAGEIPDSLAVSWQRAISMLRYSNEAKEEDLLAQIRETCKSMSLNFVQTGSLPTQEEPAYLLTCAVRECVTNAVRYAGASELYAEFSETDTTASVRLTNNGIPPEQEIVEGGGLSTLRRKVERVGGVMQIRSFPQFELTVTVLKGKEER